MMNDLMLGTRTKAHLPAILFASCFTPVENVPTLMILYSITASISMSLIMHTSVREQIHIFWVFSLRLYFKLH